MVNSPLVEETIEGLEGRMSSAQVRAQVVSTPDLLL
jgi:hypothetical protein